MIKTTIILLLISSLFHKAEAQKGEKSISGGVLLAFPSNPRYSSRHSFTSGVGLEGIGQYNFTEKSSGLLQLQLTRFTGASFYAGGSLPYSFVSASLKGGYRYQFNPKGFYGNFLIGLEQGDAYIFAAATLGFGKRFPIKDVYFIDAGLDYIVGNINRFNIKGVFSLIRKPQ